MVHSGQEAPLVLRAFAAVVARLLADQEWYPKVRKAGEVRTQDEAQAFCTYCGLPLFGPCPGCGRRNFLHFPHCSACGVDLHGPAKND
jgi:hypothetical protein